MTTMNAAAPSRPATTQPAARTVGLTKVYGRGDTEVTALDDSLASVFAYVTAR